MIDIHSHILCGMDDGARDRDTSIAMLRIAADTGTTDIVATPHSDLHYKYDPDLVNTRVAELSAAASGSPRIHRGCDFHMSFDNVQQALADPARFTINGLGYLMVEFPDTFIPPSTEERNPILQEHTPRLERWIRIGCLLQATAQSLGDRFGRAAQKTAWGLLGKGLVHVVASDAHDAEYRPPRLDIARETLTREMGSDVASVLLVDNPAAVIAGQQYCAQPPAQRHRSWFRIKPPLSCYARGASAGDSTLRLFH